MYSYGKIAVLEVRFWLSICKTGGGFRVLFVRFNLNGKLRFMVNSVQNVLFTFSKLMNRKATSEPDLWEASSGNTV